MTEQADVDGVHRLRGVDPEQLDTDGWPGRDARADPAR
jgi:hypothetical protein